MGWIFFPTEICSSQVAWGLLSPCSPRGSGSAGDHTQCLVHCPCVILVPCIGAGTQPPSTALMPDRDCPCPQHPLGQFLEAQSCGRSHGHSQQAQPSSPKGCKAHGSGIRRRVLTWDPNLTQPSSMWNGLKAIILLQGSSPVACISHKVVEACD